jgi:hypothetical protein
LTATEAPSRDEVAASMFAQAVVADPFWVGALAGIELDHGPGARFGAQLGIDLWPIHRHWLSVVGAYTRTIGTSGDAGAITVELGYGR